MLSSQVLGTTHVQGLLEGEDVLHTADALRALGVDVRRIAPGRWEITGVGVGGLAAPNTLMDMGNSGTSTRLLMGLLASYPFKSFFSGDASLNKRPMKRVITPLSQMGAQFFAREETFLPLGMEGAETPLPIEYRLPVASAQVKSAILLAGLNTPDITSVIEPEPTRDHTERMLNFLGIEVTGETLEDGALKWSVRGHQTPALTDHAMTVPADPSSAAFPIVAACIVPESEVVIENVCTNHLRTGLFETLREMGANLREENPREWQGEPVANLRASYGTLKGVQVPAERAPRMIDEYPILAVAAAMAEGTTTLHGLAELRVKESNRLQAIIDGLTACGVKVDAQGDTLKIHGTAGKAPKGGATITTNLDHRIAMSFLVMGMVSENPVQVDDVNCILTSFPNFLELMQSLGATMDVPQTQGAPRRRASDRIRQFPAMVVAIDGPAASGKETLGRRLAEYCGYDYLDTGKLYRAVGLRVLEADKQPEDTDAAVKAAKEIKKDDFFDIRLREERVGTAASIVSAKPEVRAVLLDFQRQFAQSQNGAVLDGRDIGTVVCPQAQVKIFLTATDEARAKRRYHQLQSLGLDSSYEKVLEDLQMRDKRDAERAASPLVAAEDAVTIDTTGLTADAVFQAVVQQVHEKLNLLKAA